jgi:hypothetical protein
MALVVSTCQNICGLMERVDNMNLTAYLENDGHAIFNFFFAVSWQDPEA